jgi:hypothetical protein
LRLALPLALVLLAGCASPEPGADHAVLETRLVNDTFSVTDNEIVAVDGKRFERGRHTALLRPGARWVSTHGTLRVSKQVREQHCAFELNALPGCTYRPALPAYPRPLLDQPADAQWRLSRPMTVVAQCPDTSFALQLPIECSARPLCRAGSGFESCP